MTCPIHDIGCKPKMHSPGGEVKGTVPFRPGKTRRDRESGHRCVVCGSTESLTADHIVPVAKGGTNDLDNLQTMCEPCNTFKGSRLDAFPDGVERAA